MGIIRFKEANCKNCYKCLRSCQVKSIAFQNEQAEIIDHACILCGHCFLVCPQNAKTIDSDLEMVKQFIREGQKVYVSIAPSYISYFNGMSFSGISAALRKLGVMQVEETAIGAARVSAEYKRLMAENKMKNIISTCCPTSVLLVEKYYPDLIPQLAPCLSPMAAHAKMMREAYGEDIKVVFIGPCISKKHEAGDDLGGNSGVNAVLMFEDLEEWFEGEQVLPGQMDGEGTGNSQPVSRLYPMPGGILQTFGGWEKNYKTIAVDGVDRCRELLDSLRKNDTSGYFIEMSACPGSCLGGPGIASKNIPVLHAQDLVYKNARNGMEATGMAASEQSKVDLSRFFIDRSWDVKPPREEEIEAVLQKMGKTLKEKQLNCGSCGYPSCRDKAIAVCLGKADIKMCLPHMREKAESISNVVIDNTPNGIFLLDEDFRILECNSSAFRMFGMQADYTGREVFEIFDCSALEQVRRTGRDLIDDQAYYPEVGLFIEQTIIHVKENAMYLLIVKDITNEMNQLRQIEEMRAETVDIAQKVINKQMRVAQEIASLLGETTAETKLALTKLKKSILSGPGELR